MNYFKTLSGDKFVTADTAGLENMPEFKGKTNRQLRPVNEPGATSGTGIGTYNGPTHTDDVCVNAWGKRAGEGWGLVPCLFEYRKA